MIDYLKKERGDILILSTILFVILIGFFSLSLDFGMALMKRAKMKEIANIMRDTRFTKDSTIFEEIYSDYEPGKVLEKYFVEYAKKNGFKGTLTVIFDEYITESKQRNYKIKMILEDVYPTTSLKLFGINELPIKVQINGTSTSQGGNRWFPKPGDSGYVPGWKYYEHTTDLN